MFKNLTSMQKWTVFTFLFVPLLSSLISTIHIVGFFEIGNFLWMAYVLSAAFEIGSIASAIALTVLDKISKFAVWSIFIILVFFQLLGNIFFSFEFITEMQLSNPEYLNIVFEFLNYFYTFENPQEFKVTLSILIGMPIPLISLAFLKSVIDYIGNIIKENSDELEEELELEKEIELEEEPEVEKEIELEEEPEEDVNTFVFDGDKFTEETSENLENETPSEKKTKYINKDKISDEDIEDLINKKNEIETQYEQMQKMKKQLEEFYPQVYGKRYDGK